jgi:hypothetical protein
VEIELTGGDGTKIDCPAALAKLAPTNKQAKAAILIRKFSLPRMFLQMANEGFVICDEKTETLTKQV